MARLATTFRPLGLVPKRALRNLPDTLIAEMPAETAWLLALQGYEVQTLPVLHSTADDTPWSLDRRTSAPSPWTATPVTPSAAEVGATLRVGLRPGAGHVL